MVEPTKGPFDEARAVLHMMWLSCTFARKWVARWAGGDSYQVMNLLSGAEETAEGLGRTHPKLRNLNEVRIMIAHLEKELARIDQEIDEIS